MGRSAPVPFSSSEPSLPFAWLQDALWPLRAIRAPYRFFQAATLACSSSGFIDWSALGVVHVYDEGIIPEGTYDIEVIDESCPIDDANFGDPCANVGDWCSTYNAATNEYCDAWCESPGYWYKDCYTEPTWCFNPTNLCPSTLPEDFTSCPNTTQCEAYECEMTEQCDEGGTAWAYASCYDGFWSTYSECDWGGGSGGGFSTTTTSGSGGGSP